MKNKQLHEEILDLLKNRAKMDHEYINPNFLADINGLLYDYYDCEDANVDTWIDDMWELNKIINRPPLINRL